FALNYLSRMRPFRHVDDTLGVVYTHGFAGLAGGLLVGIFAEPAITSTVGLTSSGLIHGSATLLKWQTITAVWVIAVRATGTFIPLKLVGVLSPLRMPATAREEGALAVHGHEVYPSDVPSLGTSTQTPAPTPTPNPSPASA